MRAHSSDALVLRTYRYGEADCIVVFLTADRGKKRGVAKNARQSRRRFGGDADDLEGAMIDQAPPQATAANAVSRTTVRAPLRASAKPLLVIVDPSPDHPAPLRKLRDLFEFAPPAR